MLRTTVLVCCPAAHSTNWALGAFLIKALIGFGVNERGYIVSWSHKSAESNAVAGKLLHGSIEMGVTVNLCH
jgi:hypothetical protein